jgi:hypothetical protein
MTSREEELLAMVEGAIAETRRDAERVARTDAPREELRAAAARRGELGRDWREVQARIDSGRTSLADVFGGTDASPAAVRLREQSRATIDAMELPGELPPELAEELESLQEELS